MVDFAISQGGGGSEARFWTIWTRTEVAPLDLDGALSPAKEEFRKKPHTIGPSLPEKEDTL